jgi:hypothetical protein
MTTYTIVDWGREEYLDGAMMRYCVQTNGGWPKGTTIAYCASLDIARALANGLAAPDEAVIIDIRDPPQPLNLDTL